MEVNHHELTIQLWDLLTKEEIERGEICITCDCGIGMVLHLYLSWLLKVL